MHDYEAEIKIELQEADRSRLLKRLRGKGFHEKGVSHIKDYYVEIIHDNSGGWNFTRLRNIDDKIFLRTKKKWENDRNGLRIRKEIEHELSEIDFQDQLSLGFEYKLEKYRHNFEGLMNNQSVLISLDSIDLNVQKRYFVELEIVTTAENAVVAREQLKMWASDYLDIQSREEAPTMLDLVISTSTQ